MNSNIKTKIRFLKEKTRWVKRETLKIHKIAPETRIASSLSPVEFFVTMYYSDIFRFNPENPQWEDRDRLIVSKGHGSIALYPILADFGFFDRRELEKVCSEGSFLGGIPDPIIPGYETVNGSLGHGLGVGCGIAIGLKQKKNNALVYVLVGDGELYEGANWEAMMFAAHHRLDNLIVAVDYNKVSMLDYISNIIDYNSLPEKFKSFNWDVFEINGHDIKKVYNTLNKIKHGKGNKPKAIILNTIKGHGVPSLEKNKLSHIMSIKPDVIDELLKELE
jgi:transketolase